MEIRRYKHVYEGKIGYNVDVFTVNPYLRTSWFEMAYIDIKELEEH